MRQDPKGYAATCDALAEAQAAELTKDHKSELLVTGDEDAVAPAQSVRGMADKIAGSRAEICVGCGHWTTVEKPEECAALLAKFYAQRM